MARLFRLVKGLFFVMVFFSIGVGMMAIWLGPEKVSQPIQVIFRPEKIAFEGKDSLYILLMGLDYSYDSKAQRHTKDARTDTLMLVRLEPRAREMSLLSIPRDLLVEIAGTGGGYDKINAAYSVGGPRGTIKTVENLLKLKIDHYIVVKSDVVADMVDALDGVPVTVEKQMDYDDNWAGLHIHLQPGQQILNGEQTVGYLRFRNDEEGDLGRIRRQQQFLAALIKELKNLKHVPHYKSLAEAVARKMKTDLTVEQMAALANLYKDFPLSSMNKGRLEVADYWENGIAYLVPLEGEPAATVKKLFPPLPDARLAEVPVIIEDYRVGEHRKLIFTNRFRHGGFGPVVMRAPWRQGKTVEETSLLITGSCPAAEKALPKLFPGVPVYKKASDEPPTVTLRLRDENDIL
jgi:LCP family protein required for cell wall assembly